MHFIFLYPFVGYYSKEIVNIYYLRKYECVTDVVMTPSKGPILTPNKAASIAGSVSLT